MVLQGIAVDPDVLDKHQDKIIDYPKANEEVSQFQKIEYGLVGVYTTKKEYLKSTKESKKHRSKWTYLYR